MTLPEICEHIARVRDGLASGEIPFGDTLLEKAWLTTPAKELDRILQPVAGLLDAGEDVPSEALKKLIKDLGNFNNFAQVPELRSMQRELRRYLQKNP